MLRESEEGANRTRRTNRDGQEMTRDERMKGGKLGVRR
jgi:hypothetical protein